MEAAHAEEGGCPEDEVHGAGGVEEDYDEDRDEGQTEEGQMVE